MNAHPAVSIIIPVFNDADRLALCLSALEAQDYPGPFEILVVDNGSKVLPAVTGRARLLQEATPGSYAARNHALAEATGEVLAFTDSDCVPHPGWLSAGVAALVAAPEIGMVGGRVRIQAMSGGRPNMAELFEVAVAFPQERYIRDGHYAATANMFTRRAVMDKVGPFDARLRSGGDADWGQRVHRAGYAQVYAADAVLDHPARASQSEIFTKLRRTVGGERDRRPGWGHALRFAARHAVPPRTRIRAALGMADTALPTRLRVAAYCVGINWSYAAYRLWLQASGRTSSRR
ncbi:glycosyltransferase family 2 protein [Sphingomonas profundi]|uniref:glycosyltransferase family 2 protein n=1 Tax=Alterirhizorhabdus profundi TaxID=2681549 RepID=UPI0018D11BE4|nr:glycosyltransferase family 2 protein [Sphingomonas profundi]